MKLCTLCSFAIFDLYLSLHKERVIGANEWREEEEEKNAQA